MIRSISLTHFKNFQATQIFNLGQVTLLSGYNGRGKSTLLQSLLLLSQSIDNNNDLTRIRLKGEHLDLGYFKDILSKDAESNLITISLIDYNPTLDSTTSMEFEFGPATDYALATLHKCIVNDKNLFEQIGQKNEDVHDINSIKTTPIPREIGIVLRNLFYIAASRESINSRNQLTELPESFKIQKNGINTINILSGDDELIDGSLLPSTNPDCEEIPLVEAVSRWLSYIMDCEEQIEISDPNINYSSDIIELRFVNQARKYLPQNVGFGYAYILSLLTGVLLAKPGSIIIIENPEAHLHPLAQSRLSELLTRLADNGVQIIVETHSEHIINGFRLTSLKDEFGLQPEDLSIYFFGKTAMPEQLAISATAQISNWPKGFFDQAQNDIAEIMKLGIRKNMKLYH